MGRKSAKAKGPRKRLMEKTPKRAPGPWRVTKVFKPKNAPPDINTEFELRPSNITLNRKSCTRKVGGKYGKVSNVLRDCHVELVLNQGVFLRLCTEGGKPGPLIPVKSHTEATKISRQFCECRNEGKDAKTCAIQVSPSASQQRRQRVSSKGKRT